MKGRAPTADERRYINRVELIGCLICLLWENVYTRPEIHHTDGKTKEGAHYKIIPLCTKHHRGGQNNERYTSRHPYKKSFEERYAPESELLVMTKRLADNGVDGQLAIMQQGIKTNG